MEQYGKNSFNDEEEVQNLLNKKSSSSLGSSSSSASANIPQALGTGHTWRETLCPHLPGPEDWSKDCWHCISRNIYPGFLAWGRMVESGVCTIAGGFHTPVVMSCLGLQLSKQHARAAKRVPKEVCTWSPECEHTFSSIHSPHQLCYAVSWT